MVKIGQYNEMKVVKIVDFGLYLDEGDGVEILLPSKYIPEPAPVVGDTLNVFIYRDSLNRLIATTEHPYATVGQFAFLQVKAVTSVGAFLEWGLAKDLLVPFREQKVRMQPGGIYMVYVYLDNETQRIVASGKVDKFIGNKYPDLKPGDKVKALVYARTDLGYKAVVNDLYSGMFYENELYKPLELEAETEAYVKYVRDDGKIDLTLSGEIVERVEALSQIIVEKLKANNGRLPVSDKSSPELIKELFQCSKKDFKKALGHLYKEKKIIIADNYIEQTY